MESVFAIDAGNIYQYYFTDVLLGELNQMIEVNGKDNGCITLKDHKEIFLSHLTTRLINPAKNKIGRIGKQMLEGSTIILMKR